MIADLIVRLTLVLDELRAEGNMELAERVEQAILDLERGGRPVLPPIPRPVKEPSQRAMESR